jgi:hypothetical protein
MCLNLIFSSLDVISSFCSKNLMAKDLIKCLFWSAFETVNECNVT